ncbi:MAG TPA: cation diffusion facilitator family transporter [Devosia sp.]|nr:cation diffusion facilitator family transporter [Devosia sp.]
MSSQSGSKLVIYAALVGNFLIAVTKFVAAFFTGSSAMISEGIHSLVDTGNEILLLYGLNRAARRPDEGHPFGYGREVYFWTFIVAVLVFALGGGFSIYEGVQHLSDGGPMTDPTVNYIVLAVSFLFEVVSWTVALREFNRQKGALGYFAAMRRSKDPTTFTVLLEDSVALLGLVTAFVGIFIAHQMESHVPDAIASIIIGLLLTATAAFLARESKALLVGEQALPEVVADIAGAAREDATVRAVNGVITAQVGPSTVVALVSADFQPQLTTHDIEAGIERIEDRIRATHPDVTSVFIRPQTPGHWQEDVPHLAEGNGEDEQSG